MGGPTRSVAFPYTRPVNPLVDWSAWRPKEEATLLFVVRDGEVLLIHKKRGFGAGKVNGPGGHVEAGETPLQAAVREVEEELGIVPLEVERAGELRFQFTDGLALLVHVFRASGCVGEPRETDEASPFWAPLEEIPFERMWADDRIWFPWLLRGERFSGRFLFHGETLLDFHLQPASPPAADPPDPCSGVDNCSPNEI